MIEHPYMGWLGWLLQKTTAVKLVVHTHNIEFERFRSLNKPWWPLLKFYETWVLRKADKVFCISDEDKQYMIRQLKIAADRCYDIPFGITQDTIPSDKQACKAQVAALHGIRKDQPIFLFNGQLSYPPNLDALRVILNEINPLLQQQAGFAYTIMICGKGLPEEMNALHAYTSQNVVYAGFVDNIDLYFKAADLLLNPVITGGGVKTKLIEASGFNTTVVSTQSGAIGCDRRVCGDKLVIVEDTNWQDFVTNVIANTGKPINTPSAFYQQYYWGNIADKVVNILSY
jgi:glycosyltransferase involved in cell wall biosynthesis